MDAMEHKMAEWRKKMPSKRALTSQLGQFVQQKSVQVLYTQSEQDRIKAVTELIATATSEFDKTEHWGRIMKVVDTVSNTSNKHVLKEAVRFLRLRLGDPSPRVVLLALSLTEALMNNCNRYVHKEIASEAFMAEMEGLYKVHSCKRGRDSMEIEGRVLELIQAWGETFMNQKFEYPYIIFTYQKLRKKGVKFPKFDKTKAPMINGAGGLSPAAQRRAREAVAASSSASKSSANLAKLSSKEVYHVATNVSEMFEDMLHEAEQSSDGSAADKGVIVELAAQAHELVMRLQQVIQAAADSDSEDLGKYLSINDTLHLALTRYDDLKNGKRSSKAGNNQAKHNGLTNGKKDDGFGGWASASNNQEDDDDDDGFGDFVRARVGGDSKPAATNNQTEADPFASFAAERSTKAPAPAPQQEKSLIDLWDEVPAAAAAPAQPQQPAATAPIADLWGAASLLAPPPASAPAAAPAAPKPQASPFDDLWGGLATPAPAPAAPAPTPIAPAFPAAPAPVMPGFPAAPTQPAASTANPFDFFDDFSAKATISTPSPAPAPAAAKPNPFDFGFPAPPSQPQAPAPPSKPANAPMASLNPFDF